MTETLIIAVRTTLILVHWKRTTKLNVESYFWTWDFHLQYTCDILQSPMKPENIRFESIWSIIITIIITIITRPDHYPKNHPQQNSRNWRRFVLWSITSPLPSSWSAMSRGAGLRGPNLGTWRGRCPKFRAWDMAGLVQNDSDAVSSNILDWPQMRF